MAEGQVAAWRSVGRALGHPNNRLFFGGQGISLVGTWMTRQTPLGSYSQYSGPGYFGGGNYRGTSIQTPLGGYSTFSRGQR